MQNTVHDFTTRTVLLIIFFLAVPRMSYGESLHSTIEKGNSLYSTGRYDEAMKSFVDAQIESPEEARLKYNIANTHYKMKNYEAAVKNYQDVAASARDTSLEEQSLFNLGNCMFRQGKLDAAVEYYKKALELDENDQDAKYNLEFTREEIKKRINREKQRKKQEKQQQKEKQGQQQQKSAEQKKTKQKEEQNKGDRQERAQAKQQQKQPDRRQLGTKKQQEETAAASQRKQGTMTPEEAERWLKGLKEGKKKKTEKQEKARTTGRYKPEKDW